MKKKIIATILAAVMAIGVFSVGAFASGATIISKAPTKIDTTAKTIEVPPLLNFCG